MPTNDNKKQQRWTIVLQSNEMATRSSVIQRNESLSSAVLWDSGDYSELEQVPIATVSAIRGGIQPDAVALSDLKEGLQ